MVGNALAIKENPLNALQRDVPIKGILVFLKNSPFVQPFREGASNVPQSDLYGLNSSPNLSEGESNLSPRRRNWQTRLGEQTRKAVADDAKVFAHQSVSSPYISAINKAEGVWIEDMDGRRYMGFHGNSVHYIGCGHPRLKTAIAKRMDELPFAPRRFCCDVATELAMKISDIAAGEIKGSIDATQEAFSGRDHQEAV